MFKMGDDRGKAMRNILILGLLGCLIWFATAIIRLERFHYASQVGNCGWTAKDVIEYGKLQSCLEAKGSNRTSPLWDLAYGLGLI